jgi:hypothetical protein
MTKDEAIAKSEQMTAEAVSAISGRDYPEWMKADAIEAIKQGHVNYCLKMETAYTAIAKG